MGKLEEMLDPLVTSKSMDQNQQNIIKPTNNKKIWGLFWWGFLNLGRNEAKEG